MPSMLHLRASVPSLKFADEFVDAKLEVREDQKSIPHGCTSTTAVARHAKRLAPCVKS
jgi:hypothetical protein